MLWSDYRYKSVYAKVGYCEAKIEFLQKEIIEITKREFTTLII